jgi:parallel beta-helix repeat protein
MTTHIEGTLGVFEWVDRVDAALAARVLTVPAPTGASATDTANIAAATRAAIAAGAGSSVVFPGSTTAYAMGEVTLTNAVGLAIIGSGTRINLVGTDAGFTLAGTCSDLSFEGLHGIGNGVATSGQALVQSYFASTLSRIKIRHNTVTDIRLGLSLSGSLSDVEISDNVVSRCVGIEPGQGYGIHMEGNDGQLVNGLIKGNRVTDCGRHGIYVARGDDITVTGNVIRNHRATENSGDARPAICSTRGSQRIISNNAIVNAKDGCILIGPGSFGEDCYDTLITGNIFANPANDVPMISIGDQDPAVAGGTGRALVSNNYFVSAANNTAIQHWTCKQLAIMGNVAHMSGTSGTFLTIETMGETAGDTSYTDYIYVANNRAVVSGSFVRLNSEATTAGYTLRCVSNSVSGPAWDQSAGLDGPSIECIDTPMDGIWWASGGFTGDTRVGGSIGVGNSVAATTPGSVVQKIEVFDSFGASLGFIPVYSTIT